MAASRKRVHRWRYARRLRAELLENRRMLNGAGWFGTLIHDQTGDLFAVDLLGDMDVEYLGQANTVMFDVAFSPSGELYGVGGPSEGPSELYLIDVDFENPPSAVQTTYIGVVAVNGAEPVYVNSLAFRDDGVLFAAGFNWWGDEFLFSIDTDTAIAEEELWLQPDSPLNRHQSAGDLALGEDGAMYLTTRAGKLLEIDPAVSTFDVVGSVDYGDFYGLVYGPAPLMHGFRYWTNDVYLINPTDAMATYVATLSDPWLQGILGAGTVFKPPIDLGEVDFLSLPDQQPILGELWYRLETTHDGLLTADLPGTAPGSGVEMTLYTQDASGVLYEEASGELRLDCDGVLAGEEYLLRVEGAGSALEVRLTNLVSPTVDGAIVYGTDEADLFEFEAPGSLNILRINGVEYGFDFSAFQTAYVSFLGGDGDDVALLVGSTGSDEATLWPDSGIVTGPGYYVEVTDTYEIAFGGFGGEDLAILFGLSEPDDLTLWPYAAELTGTQFRLTAIDTPLIQVDADGGEDTATFLGNEAGETVEMWPQYAEMSGNDFLIQAWDFETTIAYSGGGGDQAIFHDSIGKDIFSASTDVASLTGTGFSLTAYDYTSVSAYATEDGFDVAKLFDSPANDEFIAHPDHAGLYGNGLEKHAWGFEQVHAYATGAGRDVAKLYDSDGNDIFYATPIYGALYNLSYAGRGFYNRAKYFEQVHAYGTGDGFDVAKLYDSPLADTFYATPIYGALYNLSYAGRGFYNRAKFFEQVHAYAREGGVDVAKLYDSDGKDIFYATPIYGALYDAENLTFYNRAKFFEQVHAYGTAGGFDVAKLYDSSGTDTFYAEPIFGALYNTTYDGRGFYNRAKYFEQVHAYSLAGGFDVARLYDSDQNDTFYADPIFGALYNPSYAGRGFYNRAKYFFKVYADASKDSSDFDSAYLHDSLHGIDLLEAVAGGNWARLSNSALKYFHEVAAFDYVWAWASTDGDIKKVPELSQLSFELDLNDVWLDGSS